MSPILVWHRCNCRDFPSGIPQIDNEGSDEVVDRDYDRADASGIRADLCVANKQLSNPPLPPHHPESGRAGDVPVRGIAGIVTFKLDSNITVVRPGRIAHDCDTRHVLRRSARKTVLRQIRHVTIPRDTDIMVTISVHMPVSFVARPTVNFAAAAPAAAYITSDF